MLDALINSVLPIFSIVGIGMAFSRIGWFDYKDATVLSRYVYYLGIPVVLFRLLATADTSGFDWILAGSYVATELVVYMIAFALFFFGFRRPLRETILLSMSAVFVNHVLYLLPIAEVEFGEETARRIVMFIAVDLVIVYSGNLILLDITADGGRARLKDTVWRLITNPQIVAMILGLAANFLHVPLDNGFGVFATFISNAAAPVSLFALGITLMEHRGGGDIRVSLSIVGMKLILMPVIAAVLILGVFRYPVPDASMALLITAGPVGVLPFVLALRNDLPSQEVSRTVLLSTILSLVTVAFVLQLIQA